MVRDLVLGGVAFAVVFFAARQFDSMKRDIARYDAMSEMSGDKPLFRKLLASAMDTIGDFGSQRGGHAKDFIDSLQGDLLRYATLRSM
jgi:hypothetical protein